MTATVVEPVVETEKKPDDDIVVSHYVCHCTGNNLAWCGLDLTGALWVIDDEPEVPCPLCELVIEGSIEKCPWGCTCTDECQMAEVPEPVTVFGVPLSEWQVTYLENHWGPRKTWHDK